MVPCIAGMDHWIRNLQCLMSEAHAVGRRAELPKLNLAPKHNFGVVNEWCWDTYFDLAASRLVDVNGREHRLPVVSTLPDSAMKPFTVRPKEPIPVAAADRELVVRRVKATAYGRDVPRYSDRPPTFRIRPSSLVFDLAKPVVDELRKNGSGEFVAVHLRRGDLSLGPIGLFTTPTNIRRHLRRAGVADGSRVFFLSNEYSPRYWAALRRHHEVVRSSDFQSLAALVTRDGARRPDNYLLYEVEKEIMRAATLRVRTFPTGFAGPYHSTLVPRRIWVAARRTQHALYRSRFAVKWLARTVLGKRGWLFVKFALGKAKRNTPIR